MLPNTGMRSHKYPSIGRCIFCTQEMPPELLTDEHIIALALNGTLIFEESTCEHCREHSNTVYEQPALNAELLTPRLLLEFKRRKKKQPKPLPKVAAGDHVLSEGNFDIELLAAEYPPFITLLALLPPGKLSGEDRGDVLTQMRTQTYSFANDEEAWRFRQVTTRHLFNHTAMALTLAKIAYCYAVAECGLDGFDGAEIRDLLQGRRCDIYNFVGSTDKNYASLSTKDLHSLYIRELGDNLIVLVHLFASCKMIPYEVVVGRVNR